MPPTTPVTTPSSAGTPDATATPTHSGSATRNTTTDAPRSAQYYFISQNPYSGRKACSEHAETPPVSMS